MEKNLIWINSMESLVEADRKKNWKKNQWANKIMVYKCQI